MEQLPTQRSFSETSKFGKDCMNWYFWTRMELWKILVSYRRTDTKKHAKSGCICAGNSPCGWGDSWHSNTMTQYSSEYIPLWSLTYITRWWSTNHDQPLEENTWYFYPLTSQNKLILYKFSTRETGSSWSRMWWLYFPQSCWKSIWAQCRKYIYDKEWYHIHPFSHLRYSGRYK